MSKYICLYYRYDETYGTKDYEPHRCRVNQTKMCGWEGRGGLQCPKYESGAMKLIEPFVSTGPQAQKNIMYAIQRNEKEWEPPK